MPIPILVLAAVFLLIAVRRLVRRRVPIWAVMLAGALAVLATGQISPSEALAAINVDVMLFLFGAFVVGQALESSGYLFHLSYRLFSRARSADALLLLVLFGAGIASAFLMNDTLAIIGTPLVLVLAKQHRMKPEMLLLALAFAITLGSVMSPIGNPQNLLIAIQGGFANPFVDFARRLALPTLINLGVTFWFLKRYYRESFHGERLVHVREDFRDPALARLARLSLWLLVALVAVKIALVFLGIGQAFRLTYIALAAAAPLLLFSPRRWELARRLDWSTLVFFAAMFVLMESVWNTGAIRQLIDGWGGGMASVPVILAVGVGVSQVISNVPLVALYLPLLQQSGATPNEMLALAAASTVAGNLLILGAASNVIIIQNAESRTGHSIGFFEFARIGVPLTAVNVLVYWLFLSVL
jgi:Na+/H+ antiporter NhaD/arsenite permease-like protein